MTITSEANKPTSAFLISARAAKRHPYVSAVLVLIAAIVLVDAPAHGRRLLLEVVYLIGVALSIALIDVVFAVREKSYAQLPVRNPLFELMVAAVLYLGAEAWLIQRFWVHRRITPLFGILGLILVFDIALAVFMLARRYSPPNLGIRFQGFAPVPLVMICTAICAAMVSPLTHYWRDVFREEGSIRNLIWDGLFAAALPEEFFRMVWQTRLGAWLQNGAFGWCLASVLWASLHAPLYRLQGGFYFVVEILPYGLLLGYLTHRSQSILPAVLLHCTKFLWMGQAG